MWLSLFAHQQNGNGTLYSAHTCALKEERDSGGMESRPPQPWRELRTALLEAGIEERVVDELKSWLDNDPLNPVQVEVTEEQVNRLGLSISKTN